MKCEIKFPENLKEAIEYYGIEKISQHVIENITVKDQLF